MELVLVMILKPFFAFGCLVVGLPIIWWVKNRMADGPLRRFLLIRWD